jgi:HSP20 family protein
MALLNSILPAFGRSAATAAQQADSAPAVRPVYQVTENADAWALTVQLPGVNKEGLTITDEDGVLTIRGERAWKQPSGWTSLYRESTELPYALHLAHENEFDADQAKAEIRDGVLRLSLPKTESRKPRKIAVA